MHPTRPLVATAIAIAAWVALPNQAAHASAVPAAGSPRLVTSGPLLGGQMVDIEWTPTGPGTEELELLLSLDGGRTWRVRVSPELPGESVRYRWRVPNLAAADARVRLRVRRDEREIELPASESFVIESNSALPIDHRLVSEGSWWDGFDEPGEPAPTLTGHPDASLVASHAVSSIEETSRLVLPSRTVERGLLTPWVSDRSVGVATRPPFAVPRNQPLRI